MPVVEPLPARARFDPARLGAWAVAALLEEVRLTPKPALVDQRGSGAHHDLDLALMTRSAHALGPTFEALAAVSSGAVVSQALRERLGRLGRTGERTMLAATGGSNSHRGAIWIVGLLVAGAALETDFETDFETDCDTDFEADVEADAALEFDRSRGIEPGAPAASLPRRICGTAAEIARFPDRFAPRLESHGARAMRQYAVGGARQEACDGFPHVLQVGLPALHAARARGIGETHAQLDTLLHIMRTLADTCLLHRGGQFALDTAQRGAQHILGLGGSSMPEGYAALLALDAHLLELNASPGGAADLLAATLFIDKLIHCKLHQEA